MAKIKLGVNDLSKGMYINDLDRPWSETTFLFQGFRITNEQELDTIKEFCKFVYVDDEKSTVEIESSLIILSDERTEEDDNKIVSLYKFQIAQKRHDENFEDEFPIAKKTYQAAMAKMQVIFKDLRLGKALDVMAVKSTVAIMTTSILRNPDALKLMCAIQDRSDSAATHALHVCILTLAFASYLGLEEEMIQKLGVGGLLHDIGEIKLPLGLFWKSELYNKAELKEVHKHTDYGVDIIKNTQGLDPVVLDIVRDHHERLNATGFPRQAGGSDISYNAMLVSIVDVYDCVTMGYEGKPAISCTDALKSMYDWRNELFQDELIEHFIQCLGIYPIGSVVKLNSGEVGIIVTFDSFSRLAPRVMLLLDNEGNFLATPKMLDLSRFKDADDKYLYEIRKVVDAEECGIDIKQYILEDLYVPKVANQ
jgi:HD-GYP domain-containing protein (c-di-GMP phosphodiesterase class II)